jgi:hypothetical protein
VFQSSIRPVEPDWTWWAFTGDEVRRLPNNDMFGNETLDAAAKEFTTIFHSVDAKLITLAASLGSH